MGAHVSRPVWIIVASLVLALVVGAASTAAFAGTNPNAKIALHIKAHPTSCTKSYPVITSCSGIVFTWAPIGDLDAMPVFYDLAGFTLVETGLAWPEAAWGTGSWVRCKGDVSVGSITHTAVPANPAETAAQTNGVAIGWSTCQSAAFVLPGFVWLLPTGAGTVTPAPNPATEDYGVVDCSPEPGPYYQYPRAVYAAGIGGATGDNPCLAPACGVDPASLDFGTVGVGGWSERTFTITNTGGGIMTGRPAVLPDTTNFKIVTGSGVFTLKNGEFRNVTVRFTAKSAGTKTCTIATGTACSDVACTGVADPPPVCLVSSTNLNFGIVVVGDSLDKTFIIKNTGGGTLSGTVTESCADYSIVSGAGYSLGGGQSDTVMVRFKPTSGGQKDCTIDTGAALCADVSCSGIGEPAPACEVSTTSLNFGTVTVGNSADLTFTITNTGGGTLSGSVSETCDHYSIFSGGGAYNLTAGQFVTVTVRFAPTTAGTKTCDIQTGGSCALVSCTGVGASAEIQVYIDIKPSICPNPVNPNARGVIQVAVLGTTDFDIADIDPASVRLTRQGVVGEVAPLNCIEQDVSAPFTGPLCGCLVGEPDGYVDLLASFSLKALVLRLDLGSVKGQTVALTLTANLLGGGPVMSAPAAVATIRGSDCVMVSRGTKQDEMMIMMSRSVVTAGSQARLSFSLEQSDRVRVDVFDVHGRVVKNLMNQDLGVGSYTVEWDATAEGGEKVPAGIYFVRLSTRAEDATKKIVVVE